MLKRNGYLEVIAGPMYCGKTEELIRQAKRATLGKKKVQIFKHSIDIRYGSGKNVYSHGGQTFTAIPVNNAKEIAHKLHKSTAIIGIDEAQWFGESLCTIISTLLDEGRHIIVAGLSMTFDRQPFIPMPTLMAMADKVTKLSAVCTICGRDAVFHKRLDADLHADALTPDPLFVKALHDNVFVARCRSCFTKNP